MVKVKKHIDIDAPIEKVFDYMADPQQYVEIWPSMVEVKNCEESLHGGVDFDWVYKMCGMPFKGRSKVVEFVENERSVSVNEEGIRSKFIWEYKPHNGGTAVDLNVEYTVPMPVLGKLAEKVIVKLNENEAETLLNNLKAVMET